MNTLTESCCGQSITACRCNDLICRMCGRTRAEVEFLGAPCTIGQHEYSERPKA